MLTTVATQPISPLEKPDLATHALAPVPVAATLVPANATLIPEAVGSEPFGDALPTSALETTAL